jgi:hypothetical protein
MKATGYWPSPEKFEDERYPFVPVREMLTRLDPKQKPEPLPSKKPYVPSLLMQKRKRRGAPCKTRAPRARQAGSAHQLALSLQRIRDARPKMTPGRSLNFGSVASRA